ncbi:MAG: sensor domain-containing protein [Acidimicrobiales bacterium]
MESRSSRDQLLNAVAGLADPQSWRAVSYVSVSVLYRILLFPVVLTLLVTALVLCLIGVGIPLVIAVQLLVNRLLGVDRWLATIVGRTIQGRPPSTGRLMARFRNHDRWREVVFALTSWLPTTLVFAAVVVAWGVPLYLLSVPLWGWAVEALSWPEIILMAAAGAGLLLLSPIASRNLGQLLARYTEWGVGPDRLALLEQQVRDVSQNREEILAAVAGERRRIERNLHDGVQQRLVALGIDLGLAKTKLNTDPEAAGALLDAATKAIRESIGELRVIGRGLHPAILGDRGLDAALSSIVSTSTVPVELRCRLPVNPPAEIQEAAYFVVSEAMTNVMKHSGAKVAVVDVASGETELTISVYDDGRGGATTSGTGLAGISARVHGFGGTFELSSPPGGPTTVTAVLPYPAFDHDGPGQ